MWPILGRSNTWTAAYGNRPPSWAGGNTGCAKITRGNNVCNWAVPAEDEHPLCSSCRLTRVIPDLSDVVNKEAWYQLAVAKRRLVYSLMSLRLLNRDADPEGGLAFEFLADAPEAGKPVLTGHANGVITINIAEANDAEREKRRLALGEPYRTLLGHFRHEVGHYYWDRLIAGSDRLSVTRLIAAAATSPRALASGHQDRKNRK
jgi:hypothetical protein